MMARNQARSRRWRCVALAAALATAGWSCAYAQDAEAMRILKSMSDYVGSQPTIRATFDSDIEVITPQLEKIQFNNSGEALVSRPDKLRVSRLGAYADVTLVFDGTTATIIDNSDNRFLRIPAAGTVDQLIERLRQGNGLGLPGSDLLLSNSYDVLAPDVLEAKHIGRGIIDGVECEHLAFRNFDTDWQLWVKVGDQPIPCKLVITSKTIGGAPQYTVRIKSFETGADLGADAFAFMAPDGATEMSEDALAELDELPPGLAPGEAK